MIYWDLGGPKKAQLLEEHSYRSTPQKIFIKLDVISLQHDFNQFVTSQKHSFRNCRLKISCPKIHWMQDSGYRISDIVYMTCTVYDLQCVYGTHRY